MKAIIENDDFGLSYGFNRGISDSFQRGITQSTCLRVNSYAYQDACSKIRKNIKSIGRGVHVDLTHGPFLTKKIINSSGKYGFSFLEYFFKFMLPSKKFIRLVKNEIEAQVAKAENDGIKIDHINGHDHVHMIPSIFKIFCEVAQKHNIKWIRLVNEPFYLINDFKLNIKIFFYGNFLKYILLKIFSATNKPIAHKYGLRTTDAFYGLIYSNHMNTKVMIKSLVNALKNDCKIVEVVSHPAEPNYPLDKKTKQDRFTAWFSNQKERDIEKQVLVNPAVIRFIKENKIELVSFNKLE